MQIKLKDGNLKLYVSHFVNDHNHGLVPLKFVDLLRGHQRITEVDIAHMDNMRQVSISILKIYESIATQAGGFNMVPFTKKFRECMGGKAPKAVITDGDRSMRLAIQEVFPEAHHRLCAWLNVYNPRFTSLFRECMLADVKLEKSGALKFTWELFTRFRESLRKSVWVTILECTEMPNRCIYVAQKYHRPEHRWNVEHVQATDTFLSRVACLIEEDFKKHLGKVIQDTMSLEQRNAYQLDGASCNNVVDGGVRDPIGFWTKETSCENEPISSWGIKRRNCKSSQEGRICK
ncbi:hypothetical protein Ahy_B03g065535 [Arachis hypogaea]|uniref:MULE transposase domain-containing protein n=1 Tax=Arachis hypogaea TaxID=3818 RepID=A0A445A1V7_ARAHY|nr:hypothetical protein Ahy_B03g065535 [Arachis hypogaea]